MSNFMELFKIDKSKRTNILLNEIMENLVINKKEM